MPLHDEAQCQVVENRNLQLSVDLLSLLFADTLSEVDSIERLQVGPLGIHELLLLIEPWLWNGIS